MTKAQYHLKKSQLQDSALFCGAGISKGSGLPLANDLKKYILEKLLSQTADVQEIMSAELPFELFLESILTDELYSKLLVLFKHGEPNATHIFIAKLAKLGVLKKIITTNFDLLIEKAFSKEGLVENVDYVRFYRDQQFSTLNSQTIAEALNDKVGLFKIHGSVDDEESVRTTLMLVASKILSANRSNVLSDAFSLGDHKRILVAGYSCSDFFDVNPMLEQIEASQTKSVLFIDHTDQTDADGSSSIEDIQLRESNNPFKHFSGERIYCDTDLLVKNTWNHLKTTLGEYESVKPFSHWKPYVDDWYENLKQNKALTAYVVGALFARIPNENKAISNFSAALDDTRVNDIPMRFRCCVALGSVYKRQGHPKKAIPHYELALKIADESEKTQEISKSNCYIGLADCYEIEGKSSAALQLFTNALELTKELADINSYQIASMACGGVGRILCSQGYYDEAVQFHRNSLDLARDLGDISWESLCYVHLGSVCRFTDEPERAIKLYKKALKLAKLCSDKAIEAGCYTNIGVVHLVTKQWLKAERSVNKALRIATSTGDQTVEPLCYALLGDISLDKWDLVNAAYRYGIALTFAQPIDYATVLLGAYLGLSRVYYGFGAYKLAVEYSQQAAKYAEILGNKKAEASCYERMGFALERLEKSDEAANSFSKSKGCLEQVSKPHPLGEQIEHIKALIPTRAQESRNSA